MGWLDMLFGAQTQAQDVPAVDPRPSGFSQMLTKLGEDPALGQSLLAFGASQLQPKAPGTSSAGNFAQGVLQASMFKAALDADAAERRRIAEKTAADIEQSKAATEASRASTAKTKQDTAFSEETQPFKVQQLKDAQEQTRIALKSAQNQAEIDAVMQKYRMTVANIMSEMSPDDIVKAEVTKLHAPEVEQDLKKAQAEHARKTGDAAIITAKAAANRAATDTREATLALREAKLLIDSNKFAHEKNVQIGQAAVIVKSFEDTRKRLQAKAKDGEIVDDGTVALRSGISVQDYGSAIGTLNEARKAAKEHGWVPKDETPAPAVGAAPTPTAPKAGTVRITRNGKTEERPIMGTVNPAAGEIAEAVPPKGRAKLIAQYEEAMQTVMRNLPPDATVAQRVIAADQIRALQAELGKLKGAQ